MYKTQHISETIQSCKGVGEGGGGGELENLTLINYWMACSIEHILVSWLISLLISEEFLAKYYGALLALYEC